MQSSPKDSKSPGFPHKQRRVIYGVWSYLLSSFGEGTWTIGIACASDLLVEARMISQKPLNAQAICATNLSPRFRVLHSPACLLHLHSPPPCPHPTKMLKVVRRMRCGFEMQTSGPRDDVTGRRKAQAEDKYIAHQKAAALELKTRG